MVAIPFGEWDDVMPLQSSVGDEELEATGMLRLSADGHHRTWWATDGRRLARQLGGDEDRTYDVLISPRIVQFAWSASRSDGVAELRVTSDDEGKPMAVTVTAGGQSLAVAGDPQPYPPAEEIFDLESAAPGATASVDAGALAELVANARRRPSSTATEDVDPLFWLGVGDGGIQVDIEWPGLGMTRFEFHAAATGSRRAAVPPNQLAEAIEGLSGDVTVVVPDFAKNAIRVHGQGRDVLIMPINTTFERERDSTEELLTEVFGPDVVARTTDGEYRLSTIGTPIYAQLAPDEPPRIRVYAVVIADIESSPELLGELNDYNAHLGFARCYLADRQVIVESDLMAGTTEPEELVTAYRRVGQISDELGPMIAAMYGGELRETIETGQRWNAYLATTVSAEVAPGVSVPITEPGPWPYGDTVWVITAYNPFGRSRPDETNEADNVRLAAALHTAGAGVQRAVGQSAADDHREHGFVAWDIDRETMRQIGREFDQEAIFEIDIDDVRVISCFDDRIVSRTRTDREAAADD